MSAKLPRTHHGQLTLWLVDMESCPTRYGHVTNRRWCELESRRVGGQVVTTTAGGVTYCAVVKEK